MLGGEGSDCGSSYSCSLGAVFNLLSKSTSSLLMRFNLLFDLNHDLGDLGEFLLKSFLPGEDLSSVLINLGLDINLFSESSLRVLIRFLRSLQVSLQFSCAGHSLFPAGHEFLQALFALALLSSFSLNDRFLLSDKDLDPSDLLSNGGSGCLGCGDSLDLFLKSCDSAGGDLDSSLDFGQFRADSSSFSLIGCFL